MVRSQLKRLKSWSAKLKRCDQLSDCGHRVSNEIYKSILIKLLTNIMSAATKAQDTSSERVKRDRNLNSAKLGAQDRALHNFVRSNIINWKRWMCTFSSDTASKHWSNQQNIRLLSLGLSH
jgi:hypothetical protein